MMKSNQGTEMFFITPEIAAELAADGYEFEPPLNPCTLRLRDVLGRMSDAELALMPAAITKQEQVRRVRKSN